MVSEVRKKIHFLYIFLLLIFALYLSISLSLNSDEVSVSEKSDLISFSNLEKLSYTEILDIKNVSYCNSITDLNSKRACELRLQKCDNNSCFLEKSKILNDESSCFKIKNESLKISCSSSLKFSNLIQAPVIKNNISLCEVFETNVNKVKCRDNFYFVNSVNNDDKSLCSNILSEVFKNECFK